MITGGKILLIANKSADSPHTHAPLKEKHYTRWISSKALEILKNSNRLNKGAGFNLGNLGNNRAVSIGKKEQRAIEKSCKAKTKSSLTVGRSLKRLA